MDVNAILQLILLGVETIARIAVNPNLGLDQDGVRLSALAATLAAFGRQGVAAGPELEDFVNEIRAIDEGNQPISRARWDEITARRHAQSEAIAKLPEV